MNISEQNMKCAAEIFGGEEILICAPFDISQSEKYTDGAVILSRTRAAFIENGVLCRIIPVADMHSAACTQYLSSGALEAEIGGRTEQLVLFSMRCADMHSAAAELINDINGGAPVKPVSESDEKLCPKCGHPFIRDTKICRRCTDKFAMVKRIIALTKPCRPLYIALLVLFWVNSAVTVYSPMLKKQLVNDVLTVRSGSFGTLAAVTAMLVACALVTALTEGLRTAVSAKASNLFVRDLRGEIFGRLQRLPLGYIEKKKTGDLMQRINNDTMRIQSFIQDIALMAVNEIFLFAAIAIVTFAINVKMALLIFVPMPAACFMINKIRTNIQRRYRKQWRKMDVLTGRLNDVLNGIRVVKVFGRENDEIERFKKTAASVRDITRKNEKYVYTIFPIIRFIMGFGSYLVLLYGGSCVIGGKLSLGELVQFSAYGSTLYSKLEWFSMLPRHFSMAVASTQRVFEVLDENVDAEEYNNKTRGDIHGDFEFKNMSFGYKSYRRVLKNINEHIHRGEMVGLVGHSGAGKSTLINLVMQLYKPSSGTILLDGEQLSGYRPEEYKAEIGVVLQESYLFSGTIFDNIRYTAPDASVERVVAAARAANAHDFIMSLPDGYDTYVGEKGHSLSGGERQRIAIARAVISNPDILILDEATSSVDTETEEKIQNALAYVTKGRTVFAIAHRLSTLKRADRLIVLEDGRIAEEGTHRELEERNGIYAALLRAQIKMTADAVTIDNTHNEENIKADEAEESEED